MVATVMASVGPLSGNVTGGTAVECLCGVVTGNACVVSAVMVAPTVSLFITSGSTYVVGVWGIGGTSSSAASVPPLVLARASALLLPSVKAVAEVWFGWEGLLSGSASVVGLSGVTSGVTSVGPAVSLSVGLKVIPVVRGAVVSSRTLSAWCSLFGGGGELDEMYVFGKELYLGATTVVVMPAAPVGTVGVLIREHELGSLRTYAACGDGETCSHVDGIS